MFALGKLTDVENVDAWVDGTSSGEAAVDLAEECSVAQNASHS
jgi:hypothetical protein